MRKYLAILLLLCLVLSGCGNSGPDESLMDDIETSPVQDMQGNGEYSRNEPIVVYEETLSNGVVFSYYEDGRLLLTGADITDAIVDTTAYKDYKDDITFVEIGEGVTYVGEKVFAKAEKVTKVEISGNSVKKLGFYSFANMPELTQVTFSGNGLVEIADYAFSGCEKLTDINLSVPSLTTVGGYVFSGCKALRNAILGPNIQSLGQCIFDGCELTSLRVGCNVSQASLSNNQKLVSLVLEDTVEVLEDRAFASCPELQNVTYSKNLKSVGAYAFADCKKLKEAVLPDSVTEVGDRAFSGCEAIVNAYIGPNVQIMGQNLFAGCKELKTLECNSSIGFAAFKGLEALESVTIGTTVIDVGEQAFSDCKKLLEVILPEGVQTIGDRAFYNCEALRKLSLPRTLTSVGTEFFYGTKEMRTLYYNGSSAHWSKVEKANDWNRNPNGMTWINDFEIKTKKEGE